MRRPCRSSKEGVASSQLHPWAQASKAQHWPQEGGSSKASIWGENTVFLFLPWCQLPVSCWPEVSLVSIPNRNFWWAGLCYAQFEIIRPEDSGLRLNTEHPLLSLGYFDSIGKNLLLRTQWWHSTGSPFFSFISLLLIIFLMKTAWEWNHLSSKYVRGPHLLQALHEASWGRKENLPRCSLRKCAVPLETWASNMQG